VVTVQAFRRNLLPSSFWESKAKSSVETSVVITASTHHISSVTVVTILFQGKATGERAALWLRARLQSQLFQLGCFLHRHAGKVLFVAILVLATFCVGLKSAQVHTRVDQLWVEGKIFPWNGRDEQCMHFGGKPCKL
jgi:hypothetical protein